MLSGARPELEDGEKVGSTSSSIRAAHDKCIRNACQNALVVSVMFLQSIHNRRIVSAIVEAAHHHVEWHGAANRELRSCPDALTFLLRQAEGDFMKHLQDVKNRLGDVDALERPLD